MVRKLKSFENTGRKLIFADINSKLIFPLNSLDTFFYPTKWLRKYNLRCTATLWDGFVQTRTPVYGAQPARPHIFIAYNLEHRGGHFLHASKAQPNDKSCIPDPLLPPTLNHLRYSSLSTAYRYSFIKQWVNFFPIPRAIKYHNL